MKIMRSNYDKPWRCPNWSGPGFASGDGPCPSGSTASMWGGALDRWRFHRCPKCGTVILPNILRSLDPTWWRYRLTRR